MVNEETKTESTETDTKDRDTPKKADKIEQANAAAERLEKANKEKAELLAREEKLKADEIVSGQTEAGQETPKPKPLTDEEYANKVETGEVNPLADDGFV